MNISELKNCHVASIHYPGWDDYSGWCYFINDEGSFFSINKIYLLEKEKIDSVEKKTIIALE